MGLVIDGQLAKLDPGTYPGNDGTERRKLAVVVHDPENLSYDTVEIFSEKIIDTVTKDLTARIGKPIRILVSLTDKGRLRFEKVLPAIG